MLTLGFSYYQNQSIKKGISSCSGNNRNLIPCWFKKIKFKGIDFGYL